MADRKVRGGRRLAFDVPADVIADATQANSANCMIAVALKRALPHAQAVSVDLATIRYTDKERRERFIYLTPPTAQAALLLYDAGGQPEPFSVRANVAQIVPMNRGRKVKTDGAKATQGRPKGSKTTRRARTRPNGRSPGEVIKDGGTPPPVGALAGGTIAGAKLKTGRARRHGARVMGTRSGADAG